MGAATYQLDRKKFIEYYPLQIHAMMDYDQVRSDLVKNSEFILTAQDVLDNMLFIEGKLVGVQEEVLASDCELIYNKEER